MEDLKMFIAKVELHSTIKGYDGEKATYAIRCLYAITERI